MGLCLLGIVLALSGCFSPMSDGGGIEETFLSINFGNGNIDRVAVSSGEIPTLSYEVILDGPGGKRTETISGSSATFQVIPGNYRVVVRATGNRPVAFLPAAEFPDRMLRGWGSATANVQPGRTNCVSVLMTTATEVINWAQFWEVLERMDDDAEEIIVIKGEIAPESSTSHSFNKKVILIAEETGTINLGAASLGTLLTLPYGRITLGKEGMGGTLYIDGLEQSATQALIRISVGSELIMNDGVFLQNRNHTNWGMPGGAVSIESGGTFTMNGGTIRNNTTVGSGGGVNVADGGTFTMNGGTIRNNAADNNNGGGVNVDGAFFMNDGSISGNTSGNAGAGVCVSYGKTFRKTGGIIYGNDAAENLQNKSDAFGHALWIPGDSISINETLGGPYTYP